MTLFLTIFLIAGFLIRLFGIHYGLPDVYHPDEARIILDTLSMAHRQSFLSFDVDYPLFFKYFLLSFYGFYYLMGYLAHIFKNPTDFALQFMINPENIFLLSRFANVLLGTLTALIAYLLGKKFYNKRIGFLAAIFILFEFQLVAHSQYALHQTMAAFVTLPVFYFYFKVLCEDSVKNFFFVGLVLGIAFSIHHTAVLLIPSLLTVLFFHFWDNRQKYGYKHFAKRWGILFFSATFFSILGNLNWIFQFDKSLRFFRHASGAARVGFSSKPPFEYSLINMGFWFLKELLLQDMLIGFFLILGLFYSLFKRKREDIIFLVFVISYLVFHYNWAYRWLHLLVGLLPIMCIYGARCFEGLLEKFNIRKLFIPLVLFTLAPSVFSLLEMDIRKNRLDTRQIAKNWIEENIPSETKIAIDWTAYSVPLLGGIPTYLRNPVGYEYYTEKLDDNLKERYKNFLKTQKTYDIYEGIYKSENPIWPGNMPSDVVEKIKDKPVFKDLYSYFNFRTPKELKENQVEYLVTSSYSYSMFLLDDDPHRQFSFDPFVKDKMGDSYRQSDHFIDDNRHGFVFYVAERGRDFYKLFLDEKIPGVELVKEFIPSKENPGPAIKIYKFNWEGTNES